MKDRKKTFKKVNIKYTVLWKKTEERIDKKRIINMSVTYILNTQRKKSCND